MPRTAIVFIHGLGNKPEALPLVDIWRRKLGQSGGLDLADLGIESEMVYWADVLYERPDTNLAVYEAQGSEDLAQVCSGPAAAISREMAADPKMAALLRALGVSDLDAVDAPINQTEIDSVTYERVPLPAFARNRLMKLLARDAYLYFHNEPFTPRPDISYQVRDEIRNRFVGAVAAARAGAEKVVVVSHSMGTIIAYDCLKSVPDCPPVDGLVTAGSPLGLDEVQDFLAGWTRDNGFPDVKLGGPWINVFDRLDIVAGGDPFLANDFLHGGHPRIEDLEESNSGVWRHSISKYLQGPRLRAHLAGLLGVTWP